MPDPPVPGEPRQLMPGDRGHGQLVDTLQEPRWPYRPPGNTRVPLCVVKRLGGRRCRGSGRRFTSQPGQRPTGRYDLSATPTGLHIQVGGSDSVATTPLNLGSPPGHGPDNQSMASPRAQQLQDQLPGLLEKVQQRGPRLYSESVSRVVIIVFLDTHNCRSQAIVEYQNRARGGTRTHTSVRTARFKRAASASCATRALLSRYRHRAGRTSRRRSMPSWPDRIAGT